MPSCFCGKNLASPAGLRRHINSQHDHSEYHVCECGKSFLDPAGRSRCRARHQRSFGCSGCTYRSGRKDSVKQHIRRIHRGFQESLEILTFPFSLEQTGYPPSAGVPIEFAPTPLDPLPFQPPVHQPHFDSVPSFSSPSPPYYSEGSSPPERWTGYW